MPQKRPYISWFDATLDIPVQQQGDDPIGMQFVPYGVANKRTLLGGDGNSYLTADLPVNPRGSKSIIWSSEGYTSNGNTIPALTANQKKATGLHTANAGTGALDLSPYRNLALSLVLTSFTAGTSPSFQFEVDVLDDVATPTVIPLIKPTALTAAGSWYVAFGPGVAFPQAAAAPTVAATGFAAIAVPAGYTYEAIPLPFLPNGQFQWTVTGAPTAIAWSAILYGIS